MPAASQLPRAGILYVVCVAAVGAAIIAHSIYGLAQQNVWLQWAMLAAFTLLSGSATVKLPSVPATISISETFVFTSVLLFGPAAGAVIDALDGLIISLWLAKRRREWFRIAFNMAAPALSIWIAANVYFLFPGVRPLMYGAIPIEGLIIPLGFFALSHFLVNTWLIAIAVSFETARRPFEIWRGDFLWLVLNYFGGASVAALLVVYTQHVNFAFLGIIVPLLLVLYFTFKIPMARVEDTNRHLGQVNSLYLSTIETLAMAIDAKDQVTHGHIRRVQTYAVGLGRALGICDPGLLKAIEASALLHDMGKLAVPEYILNKPGKLTPAEFDRMKLHASIGADILSAIEFPYPVVPIVRHHHENWDGTGYPYGLSGTEIPIGARILSVVDCYDALTSDRPYRPRLSDEAATRILLERRGTMYDPLVVDAFIRVHRELVPSEMEEHSPRTSAIAAMVPRRSPAEVGGNFAKSAVEGQAIVESVSWLIADASHLTIDEKIDAFCARLRQFTGASVSMLAVYDTYRDDLKVSHVAGIDEVNLLNTRIPLGQRLTGWVAANRQTILNSDPALDFVDVAPGVLKHLTSTLAVPLCDGETLVGVLSLYDRQPFAEGTRRALELLGQALATVVRECEKPEPNRASMSPSVGSQRSAARSQHEGSLPVGLVHLRVSGIDNEGVARHLERVAAHFGQNLRSSDLVIRYSASELVFLLLNPTANLEDSVVERLRAFIAQGTGDLRSTIAAIGCARLPHDGPTVNSVLEVAMHRAITEQLPSSAA